MEEVIVIGAGPCGLAAAIELERAGMHPLVLEKNVVAHSIYLYPTYMQFFSTPELLEIGGYPFTTPNEKPSRLEALTYYRTVARHSRVRLQPYEKATAVNRQQDGTFLVVSTDRFGESRSYPTKSVVVATGYFDHPNLLGIPGEELPHVTHFYREAHPYTGMKVCIIGGNNSAIDAALDLLKADAEPTIVYRGGSYSANIKPWVLPVFESMVNKGRIRMLFSSRVEAITPRTVAVRTPQGMEQLDSDFVLALTGFRASRKFLADMGIHIMGDGEIPQFDPETMETNIPGLYLAGVVAAGQNANEIFIETGRHHGKLIVQSLLARR
ncbi:MAG: bacillithiol biosynthesis thiol disulfide oxidoreductase YpdA [Paenibacillaceae bacterium]|jgi:thioredoxin reductase (NADPH)|nr:bacillithiol biosynthesis thiol disulfide oxidoreductase YpdA [Paenibacillaceae bacterium]